jgi:hypothetical protein
MSPSAMPATRDVCRASMWTVVPVGPEDGHDPSKVNSFGAPRFRIPMRPEAYDRPGEEWAPATPTAQDRPRVLLSAGTSVDEPAAMTAMATSLVSEGMDVVLTETGDADLPDVVEVVPFVPIARILPHVDAVVTAGGIGTVLATLAAVLPLVIRPFMADQPWNAARATELGAAVTIYDDSLAGKAVREALAPARRDRARSAARADRSSRQPGGRAGRSPTTGALSDPSPRLDGVRCDRPDRTWAAMRAHRRPAGTTVDLPRRELHRVHRTSSSSSWISEATGLVRRPQSSGGGRCHRADSTRLDLRPVSVSSAAERTRFFGPRTAT